VAAATASNDTNDMKTKRRRINKSVVHRRLDDIERALDVFGDGVRDHLQRLRHDTFYDGSKRPDVATAATKAEKRRGRRGGQRVHRAQRGRAAAVAASTERGVVASGDAKPGPEQDVKTNTTQDPKRVAAVEWVSHKEMKLGQRRRLKTEKTERIKDSKEEQTQIGWRKRMKAVEWRACKAEAEVKKLKVENTELQRAVATGVQPQEDPTLKGVAPEVVNFLLQHDVGVRECQLRELRVQHQELQEKTERLGQLLQTERERVQEVEQRLSAVQVGAQQKAEQYRQQIEQLEQQIQKHAEGAQKREWELRECIQEQDTKLREAEDGIAIYRHSADLIRADGDKVKAELSDLQSRVDSADKREVVVVSRPSPQQNVTWTVLYDQYNRMFWQNSLTGVAQWERPF